MNPDDFDVFATGASVAVAQGEGNELAPITYTDLHELCEHARAWESTAECRQRAIESDSEYIQALLMDREWEGYRLENDITDAANKIYSQAIELDSLRAQLKAKDEAHEKEREEFQRIRALCIRALVRATGFSAEDIECAPLTRAIEHADSVKAKDEALTLADDLADACPQECDVRKDRAWRDQWSCGLHGVWFRHSDEDEPANCPVVDEYVAPKLAAYLAARDRE